MIYFIADTWHLWLRYTRATIRLPIWIAVTLIQPVIFDESSQFLVCFECSKRLDLWSAPSFNRNQIHYAFPS